MKIILYIITSTIVIAVGISMYYRMTQKIPCTEPIYFTIVTVDQRFGLSKSKFVSDINQAISVWNNALNKPILLYDSDLTHITNDIKINLIYDSRQQVTNQLNNINSAVNDQKYTYSTLKIQYDALSKQYAADKITLDSEISSYNQALKLYNSSVAEWNNKGGAPRDQLTLLETQKQILISQLNTLNNDQTSFNQLVDRLNSLGSQLKNATQTLNNNVTSYNKIGTGISEQFSEGEYIDSNNEQRINIYQYSTENQLIRVLEHEFGHALGLGHVTDPQAVMYYLNTGTNKELSTADLTELKAICTKK